ncbi:uncharacterized protein [Amphiura filiformis]|uniref:uncharacterized protein n=1 Tax=Amphiura filiformis TaxID=82378 RepID=UPI003B20EEBF
MEVYDEEFEENIWDLCGDSSIAFLLHVVYLSTFNSISKLVQNILPVGYDYHVCQVTVEESSNSDNDINFTATLRLALQSEKELDTWREDFQEVSYATWRVLRQHQSEGQKILFKKTYRCQHNTLPVKSTTNANRRVPSKHTNCQASMTMVIKKFKYQGHKLSRSKDTHLPKYPTEIKLDFRHNHPIFCADALKYRDVSDDAKSSLTSLFKRKYGPTQAVEMMKYKLQMKFGEDYHIKAADRAICPDIQFAHR